MTITDDELKAQAESYAATDAASRGPRHAGISDEELCKALRHRAGLPETCATDAYVMLQAEQRIKLALRQSSPPDGQTAPEPFTLSWWNSKDLMVSITELGEVMVNDREAFQALFDDMPEVEHGGIKCIHVRPVPSETKAPGEEH